MEDRARRDELTATLRRAGFVAADEEAVELTSSALDRAALDSMVARRLSGEPLAWITGRTTFLGTEVLVDPGVYVPRWQSEALASRAAELLPADGVAVDLCTGAGAIAKVLQDLHPRARVLATELDPVAARCADRNGVTVLLGDLDDPLPVELRGAVDVMTGVVPYVPSGALASLPRDVASFEPSLSLDGGAGGFAVLERAVARSSAWLRVDGHLLLECGMDQVERLSEDFEAHGYSRLEVLCDPDGDERGVAGRLSG